MFWGSGVWQHAEEGSRALRASPVFSTMVSGPRTAVRDAWNLGPDEDVDWATYLLKAKLARVREAVAAESCVYVTFVNLTNEVVIAGDASGCRRVIEALDCHALPVPASVAIHNEAISSAHGALVDLYMHPVVEKPDVAFYSVANYGTLTLDERSLAEAMATMCCQPVDFPRLVSHVYDEGARIFLELGPLATCTRRIGRILRGRPHAAVAVNPSPGDDLDGFIRALAVLVAHRVPLDLAPLYERPVPDVVTIAPREQHAPLPAPVPEAVPEPAVLMSAVAAQAMGDSVAVPAGAAKPAVAGAVSEASVDRAPAAEGAGSAPTGKLMDLYADQLLPHRQGVARMHEAFLLTRSVAQERASSLISMQIAAGRQHLGHRQRNGEQAQRTEARQRLGRRTTRRPAALFDEAAVSAFASGDVTDCFGSDFEIYEGRRLSRIPNGDLLMMSRVLETEGEPHTVAPLAALSSEFDVPVDAWFYAGDVYAGLPPNIVLMEMALQPCGFLSAYLRSSFLDPDGDLYFRNLDGRGRVLADLDLRGKTVRNEVRLLSSTRGQGAIIQSFDFRMLCEGIPFYEGWSSFGFFPQASLERQVGIGAANETQGRQERAGGGEIVRITEVTPKHRVAPVQLTLVNEISVQAPQPGAVLLTATGRVTPEDWYFKAHFYQDPVMPGSLGVEAAYQAMVGYARARYPRFTDGVVRPDGAQELTWKYRGQITPRDSAWLVRVRMTDVDADQARARLVGSAEIWKGDTQIYQVDGLALQLCRE